MPLPPRASVVIPAHQACSRLLHSLAALCWQTCAASDFEVIVVDDGSADGTTPAVRRLAVPFHLVVIRLPRNRGRAAARNAGVRAAAGDLLVCLDADMLAPPEFLEYGPDLSGFALPWLLSCTGNLSVARRAVLDAGGFCEEFRGWGLEDQELGYRLHQAGLSFHNAAEIAVYHQEHPGHPQQADNLRAGTEIWLRRHPDLVSAVYFLIRRPLRAARVLDQIRVLAGGPDPPAALLELVGYLMWAYLGSRPEERPAAGWGHWAGRLGGYLVDSAARQYRALRRRQQRQGPGQPGCAELLDLVDRLVYGRPP